MVQLDVVNVLGQTLISRNYNANAGNNSIDINVDALSNGVYFANLNVNGDIKTIKVTVSK